MPKGIRNMLKQRPNKLYWTVDFELFSKLQYLLEEAILVCSVLLDAPKYLKFSNF